MKKLILLLAALTLLSGCSGSDIGNTTGDTQNTSFEIINTTPSAAAATEPASSDSKAALISQPATDASAGTTASAGTQAIALVPVCQYPELPTGCEVTSLTMVLNYYHVGCDKCEIADNYLTKGEVGTVDFHYAFEGDPRDENSYGCYANVIVETARRVIDAYGAALSVSDLTGTALEGLKGYLDRGIPLIVWGTQDCREGYYSVTWNVDGKDLTWFTPEHCMVLVSMDDNTVQVADPIYGSLISYDRAVFESCYDSLFQQAVAVFPNDSDTAPAQ